MAYSLLLAIGLGQDCPINGIRVVAAVRVRHSELDFPDVSASITHERHGWGGGAYTLSGMPSSSNNAIDGDDDRRTCRRERGHAGTLKKQGAHTRPAPNLIARLAPATRPPPQ
ncbi:MAG UNVERIFIED_CONTAM: hypothetical protein LVT10_01865 [Anaerolineae bacterium]